MIPLVIMLMAMMTFCGTIFARRDSTDPLCSSSCGRISNISSPFRLTTDPLSCGDLRYNLSCENNLTVLYLLGHRRYYVEAINYNNYTIRLLDPDIQKDDCSPIPTKGLTKTDLTFRQDVVPSYETYIGRGLKSVNYFLSFKEIQQLSRNVIFFNCERPVLNHSYVDTASCAFNDSFLPRASLYPSNKQYYSYYYVFDDRFKINEFEESCRLLQMSLIANLGDNFSDVHNALVYGFELSWLQSFAKSERQICYIDGKDSSRVRCVFRCIFPDDRVVLDQCDLFSMILGYVNLFLFHMDACKYIVGFLLPRATLGISLIGFLIYKWQRRHLSIYDGIEEFLRYHNNLMPIRYSYREIKKMTKGFKDKLGQGGFGSVYKGKLRSGRLVAIKMLSKSKASGRDFINEVDTIGRIHHVNVVRLIGFSVDGLKRALIYDFMPNGSLDKYIFSREEKRNFLSAMEIFEISLGIARGIDYLHQGCDTRILHFDIKPHNILLDENFVPKVSDFGLARLCPSDNSMVSLTAVQGTMGYMAPELFYKNIGGVSHKVDVYSYGMLLMEMANRRHNLNSNAERSSQVYFPLWIYGQFSQGNDIEIENAAEEELKIIKKMVIVALWCIQLKPCDRPSMNKAIEMLEGDVECLEIPPKLYLYPQEDNNAKNRDVEDHKAEDSTEISNATCMQSLSNENSTEICLISNSYKGF